MDGTTHYLPGSVILIILRYSASPSVTSTTDRQIGKIGGKGKGRVACRAGGCADIPL